MKYIKLFNEAIRIKVSNEFFKRISQSEFNECKNNLIDFNTQKIISVLQENQYDSVISILYGRPSTPIAPMSSIYSKTYQVRHSLKFGIIVSRLCAYNNYLDYIDVYEAKDEWFYVYVRDEYETNAFYQCDQYDGLIELLKYLNFI